MRRKIDLTHRVRVIWYRDPVDWAWQFSRAQHGVISIMWRKNHLLILYREKKKEWQ